MLTTPFDRYSTLMIAKLLLLGQQYPYMFLIFCKLFSRYMFTDGCNARFEQPAALEACSGDMSNYTHFFTQRGVKKALIKCSRSIQSFDPQWTAHC